MAHLHRVSDFQTHRLAREICKVVSGYLQIKIGHKLVRRYRKRYAELVYVSQQINLNVTSGHYELRFFKSKCSSKPLQKFTIDPSSMTLSIEQPLAISFTCNNISVHLCAPTDYCHRAWSTAFQTLIWQYQPEHHVPSSLKEQIWSVSSSLVTPPSSFLTPDQCAHADAPVAELSVLSNVDDNFGKCASVSFSTSALIADGSNSDPSILKQMSFALQTADDDKHQAETFALPAARNCTILDILTESLPEIHTK